MGTVFRGGCAVLLAACVCSAAFAAPPARKGDANKVICRTLDETGSRLASKRVCLTREQWRQEKDATRQDLEKSQRIRTGPDLTG